VSPAGVDVVVRVPGALRSLCKGAGTLPYELPDEAPDRPTVADVLDAVGRDHPALERRIRDEQGTLRIHVNLFVGDDNIRALDGLATVLGPGDELSILAAISGG
jgi:molybdopterin synthase sulfur carrier subunit